MSKRLRHFSLPCLAGALALLGGLALHPSAVQVTVHARRDVSEVYWRGSLPEPAIADGGFFLQKLVNHYRSPPLPFPERTPRYRVRFTMDLVARSDGEYDFELDSPWHGAVEVEGRRVLGDGPFGPSKEGTVRLRAGVHRVVMLSQPAGDPDQPMRLLWREPGGRLRPVTARDLTLTDRPIRYEIGARSATPLVWLGALLVALAVARWVTTADGTRRLDVAIALALVMGVGLAARVAHYDTYPRLRIDESHNAWAGFNLIHEGHPRSWSWLPVYDNERLLWFSYAYPMVADTFDHPPLLPLLAGIESTLLGAEDMFDCTLPRIRPLMVLVGTLSVGLLLLVGREVSSFPTAFVAATLMAVSPLVVFNSRLLKEDGLVQLFLLLGLYAYLSRRGSPWLLGLVSGLAALSKVMGIAIGFALSAVTFAERGGERRIAPAAQILGVTLLLASLYPLYGLALDGDTYRRVTGFLTETYSLESFAEKFLILPRMILEPRVSAATPLIDGWVLLGWLSLFYLFRSRAIAVTFVCYLLALMMSVNSENLWGFYLEPLFPILCLAAAFTVTRAVSRLQVLPVFLVVALGFLPQYASLLGAPRPGGFRGIAFLAFLPLIPATLRLAPEHPLRRMGRMLVAAMVVIGILACFHRVVTTL